MSRDEGVQDVGERLDPLVEAIKYIARTYGNFATDSVILAGLPLDMGGLPIKLVERAAANCGMRALTVTKSVTQIPAISLPALLVMEDSTLRVLVDINQDHEEATLVDPLAPDQKQTASFEALKALYSNHAIFFKPTSRSAENEGLGNEGGGHWFWSTIKSFWRDYTHVAIAALVINTLALASPLFVMNVYDRVLPNFAIPTLWALAAGVILALVFDAVLKTARTSIINVTGKQADLALASKIFAHALSIDMQNRPSSTGQFANHIKEFEAVREFFTSSSLVALIDLCFIGLFLAILFVIVGPIAYVPMAAVPIVIIINLLVQPALAGSVDQATKESALRHSVLVESVANMDTVRALNAEGVMQTKWERSVASSAAAMLQGRFWSTLAQSLTGLVQAMVSVVIVIWGVYLVNEGLINMGGIIAAMMLSGRVLAPLSSVANTLTRLRQTIHAYKILEDLMAMPAERRPGRTYVNSKIATGAVKFEKVTFRYPGASDDSLRDLSFSINAGETIGLIGRVGAGKSTIGRLLSGLYTPTNGAVLVDLIDTRQYDPADLRDGVGFLSQDNVLFSGSVRENIAIGRLQASNEEILQAARIAGVEDFVSTHPQGFDMQVGEGGRLLSGGQKQCVALARMLLRRPKVLFLDEPSSNLDMASERRLLARLEKFNQIGTTVIISTHRTSLLKLTQRIIAVDSGRVVADGPRDAVLSELKQQGEARMRTRKSEEMV
ncbi:type I secretion system permease/ATPase [Pseudovibrio exalbescens]|uniref:type I secretion system permease/ATPase n=1 Tax=Pseudovibrio exalbescens TaxID=197461 RepID=UPI0023657711|nr:type I secretion system permease/ATPase [Pseudovibrio exalbescens]MDD7912151.1 type I secretion system permease/ATPase [Pseudovibrio exalbescens]